MTRTGVLEEIDKPGTAAEKVKRRIAVIVGSASDLKGQCRAGLLRLKASEREGLIEIVGIGVCSVHRNHDQWVELIRSLRVKVDVMVVGAGWANHLTGMTDSLLRYKFKDTAVTVVGVAFEDLAYEKHTLAAQLSMSEVPGTKAVLADTGGLVFTGPGGFEKACMFAIEGKLPEIKLPDPKPSAWLSVDVALELSQPTTEKEA